MGRSRIEKDWKTRNGWEQFRDDTNSIVVFKICLSNSATGDEESATTQQMSCSYVLWKSVRCKFYCKITWNEDLHYDGLEVLYLLHWALCVLFLRRGQNSQRFRVNFSFILRPWIFLLKMSHWFWQLLYRLFFKNKTAMLVYCKESYFLSYRFSKGRTPHYLCVFEGNGKGVVLNGVKRSYITTFIWSTTNKK